MADIVLRYSGPRDSVLFLLCGMLLKPNKNPMLVYSG